MKNLYDRILYSVVTMSPFSNRPSQEKIRSDRAVRSFSNIIYPIVHNFQLDQFR